MVNRTAKNRAGGRIAKKHRNGKEDKDDYEASRVLRIEQNKQRLKSLGILDLSRKLNSKPPASSKPGRPKPIPPPSDLPPRRSRRLRDMPRRCYSEKHLSSMENQVRRGKKVEIRIPPGKNPEIYREKDERMLGDSQTAWALFVDGYDEDGQLIYDPNLGKSCHQCRHETIGLHTECSNCKTGSGQFCGDCLYMRYGENVSEVNQNPAWVCPVCRGICNCNCCRSENGWAPTGAIYKKVVQLGFKSVAHYLIHTYRGQVINDVEAAGNLVSVDEKEKSDDVSCASIQEVP